MCFLKDERLKAYELSVNALISEIAWEFVENWKDKYKKENMKEFSVEEKL